MKRARARSGDDDDGGGDSRSSDDDADTLGGLAASLAAVQQERRAAYERRLGQAPPPPARRTRDRRRRAAPPPAAAPPPPALPSINDSDHDEELEEEEEADDGDGGGGGDDDETLMYGELSEEEEAYAMAAEDEERLREEADPFDHADPADAAAAALHDPRTCYGCRYCGERRPGQSMGAIEKLITNAQEGLMTSDWNAHFRAVSREYEETIRKPANERRKAGQLPLPVWGPSQVRRHVLQDSKDPMVRQLKSIVEIDRLATITVQEDLVRRRRNARRADGRMRRTMDDKALDKYCKLKRLQLEYERWDARKSPFYNPNKHLSTRNLPNPMVDTTHKTLYMDEYRGRTLDSYWKKRDEATNAAAAAASQRR